MEKVELGNSGMQITRLCLGTWNMGGGKGWGPEDDGASVALIREALDRGCNFLDTARGYGRGRSEELVGKAVEGRRDEVVIATKVTQCPPKKASAQIEESLRCLNTDYVDLYICHWPRPSLPLEEFFEELARHREAGKVRAIGVSNFNLEQMRVAIEYGAVSLQPPLSILWRIPDDLLAFCRENKVAVTPYSPLAQGLLAGRFTRGQTEVAGPRENNVLFSEEIRPHSYEVARQVDRIADKLGCSSSQVALAWLLQTPGITCPVVGASRLSQWLDNEGALEVALPEEDYNALDQAGRRVWEMLGPDAQMWGWKPA